LNYYKLSKLFNGTDQEGNLNSHFPWEVGEGGQYSYDIVAEQLV